MMKMGDVVRIAEGSPPRISSARPSQTAGEYLVSRIFTDAIFNYDIRSIINIVQRVDGGVPKDTEVSTFRTMFGDCLNDLLNESDAEKLVVSPDDTVMMVMCKSLYDISIRDIYHDHEGRTIKPSADRKAERDAARRLILERAGGRKTAIEKGREREAVEIAGWISCALPEAEKKPSDLGKQGCAEGEEVV